MKKQLTFIFLLLTFNLFSAVTYTSLSSGSWSTPSVWDNGVPVDAANNVVRIKTGHEITATNLVFDNQFTIIIENGGKLIINAVPFPGDAIVVKNNLSFNIITGGVIIINGNFIAKNNAILTVDGTLSIDGDLTAGNGSQLLGGGLVSVTGTVSGPPSFMSDPQLPIELLYFRGYNTNNGVVLEWSTSSEVNNDYFIIETSTDAINWGILSTIDGSGNSSEIKTYNYIDNSNIYSYFRLKQVDYDGKSETFNIVSVNLPINETLVYNVYDLNGRFIGKNNLKMLSSGIYIIGKHKIIIK